MSHELAQYAQHWVNVVLIWVGFGTLAGLLAKVVLPLPEPPGPMSTVLLGMLGSVAGLLVLSLLLGEDDLNPISPAGFLASTLCAFCLLVLYRLVYACIPESDEDIDYPDEL
jgi:uncharacterized membrane protein YeaQ/YmgE (transglycosylase-associated protein family)